MQVFDKTTQNDKPIFWKVEDHHYLTLWDAKDLPNVNKWQEKIRQTHDEKLITEFFDLMNRRWDDHKNLPIEPHQVSKVDDVLTFKGVAKFCRLITKQDSTTFTHVAVGTAGDPTFVPFNDELQAEEDQVSFVTNGFFDAAGTSLRYGGTFDQSMPTETYSESLVRNKALASDSGMITMCLNAFGDDPINHTSGNTGFTAAGSIEFNVIMD